jgi:hypothetical protein
LNSKTPKTGECPSTIIVKGSEDTGTHENDVCSLLICIVCKFLKPTKNGNTTEDEEFT